MKVVGYTRVSLDEGGERGVGLAAQKTAIVAEAAARGWQLIDVLEDAGYSGRDCNRPALAAALNVLCRSEAAVLLVSKLDRLSRSILDFTGLMARARKEGWAITALDCSVDTTTPAGEAMANVMATFAQYERRLIAQRTSDALKELRSQGRAYGPTPFGYQRDGTRLMEHDDEQRVVERMLRLRRSGKSYDKIAKVLNAAGIPAKRSGVWYAASVRSVMRTAPNVGCVESGGHR